MGEEVGEQSVVEEGADSEVLVPSAEGRQIYDLESIFPQRKGFRARRRNKSKLRLVERVDALLFQMLGPDERVLFLCKATGMERWEMFFEVNYFAWRYNYGTLVLTNSRIISIETTSTGNPKYIRRQVKLANIIRFDIRRFFQTLTLYLADNEKTTFRWMNPHDLDHLKNLLGEVSFQQDIPISKEHCYQSLCYSCHKPMPEGLYVCPNCQTEYRTPKKAILRSLILPGWGKIYLKRTAYGLLELLGFLVVVLIFLILIMVAVSTPGVIRAKFLIFFFLAIMMHRLMDVLVPRAMARKGLVPVKA